jgi:hypothetical protein
MCFDYCLIVGFVCVPEKGCVEDINLIIFIVFDTVFFFHNTQQTDKEGQKKKRKRMTVYFKEQPGNTRSVSLENFGSLSGKLMETQVSVK